MIASDEKPTSPAVPERESKHSVESLGAFITPFLVTVNDHFCIRLGPENMAPLFQIIAQLNVVVYFSIENHLDALVLVGNGLCPSFEVDDAEATVRQADTGSEVHALPVWTAMDNARIHSVHCLAIDRPT